MSLVVNLLIMSTAVYLVSRLVPGIRIRGFGTAIWVSIVYGIVNLLIGWLLTVIAWPLIAVAPGLCVLFINAVLLAVTDKLVGDFEIRGVGTTLLAAFLITVVHTVVRWALG